VLWAGTLLGASDATKNCEQDGRHLGFLSKERQLEIIKN